MEKQSQEVSIPQLIEIDSYEINKPSSLVKLASTMQKYIDEQNLFSVIQGKKFPNVEAWQFAGLSLGIIPIASEPINLSSEGEIKFSCQVKLIQLSTGNVIGAGSAICSNKEKTKATYAEYAIASMSQTRAVGKAYRLMLSFLMKSAGFEVTPAEEISEDDANANKLEALIALTKAGSREALNSTYHKYKAALNADLDFQRTLKIMGERFPKVQNQPV